MPPVFDVQETFSKEEGWRGSLVYHHDNFGVVCRLPNLIGQGPLRGISALRYVGCNRVQCFREILLAKLEIVAEEQRFYDLSELPVRLCLQLSSQGCNGSEAAEGLCLAGEGVHKDEEMGPTLYLLVEMERLSEGWEGSECGRSGELVLDT